MLTSIPRASDTGTLLYTLHRSWGVRWLSFAFWRVLAKRDSPLTSRWSKICTETIGQVYSTHINLSAVMDGLCFFSWQGWCQQDPFTWRFLNISYKYEQGLCTSGLSTPFNLYATRQPSRGCWICTGAVWHLQWNSQSFSPPDSPNAPCRALGGWGGVVSQKGWIYIFAWKQIWMLPAFDNLPPCD